MRRSFTVVDVAMVLALLSGSLWTTARGSVSYCRCENAEELRPHIVAITEFGAVGDGVTLNTKAFQNAIFYLNSFTDKGGARLFVPAGRWLTGSFDLISHLTLWLDKDAVILASTDPNDWPVIDPLPSYGRGRELPGGRHQSLIYGLNLTDVYITGNNGTIDGQGHIWWDSFRNQTLDFTRPHLVELMNSTGIVISNLTFLNPPFRTIHPVYCSQVIVQNLTIRAPLNSPNTDGIDPDSSTEVCIEECFISTGDDIIAIKSGWDQYGISYARPSANITIRRLIGETSAAGIAIGSEMSGGISEIYAEDLLFYNSSMGINVKTSSGRGGYVRNIYASNMTLFDVDIAIRFTGEFGEHPDESYDPKAIPKIEKITIKDVTGENIKVAGLLAGIKGDNFADICLSNVSLSVSSKTETPWNCSFVQGYSHLVLPEICETLKKDIFPDHSLNCYRLSDHFQVSDKTKDDLSGNIVAKKSPLPLNSR